MANPEHLEKIKKGVRQWNNWRWIHKWEKFKWSSRRRKPDLSGADLSGANLSGVNLRGANLQGADLQGANLQGASLDEANLTEANLRGTTLTGANLTRAKLFEADLGGADLRGANLDNADLSRATLKNATLTPKGEPVGLASYLDLATTVGLETTQFGDSSFLLTYLADAFSYAHRPNTIDAERWPGFVQEAIKRINLLRALLQTQDELPPSALIEVIQTITSELIKYLKAHPQELYALKPRQFEELIAEILASYGWEVQLTPPMKDGGYDIFAVSKDIAGVRTSWIIECKKYREDRKIGVDIVRGLFGVKLDLKVANAMLATTSYFTQGAEAYKASRYDLELKDYEGILEWINEYRPNPDGKLYIKDNRLVLPGEE